MALMTKKSAGLLMYRFRDSVLHVLLVHPGGPFWKNKDQGAWSIPKGEYENLEDPLSAAVREFQEETGHLPRGPFKKLKPVRQKGGKTIAAWACEGDLDPSLVKSNTFTLEWPPRSGRAAQFPEIDQAGWFPLEAAREKMNRAQITLLDELCSILEQQDSEQYEK
jgi:predicted NUDIX family NTP pyrophosphohydrolase